MKKSFLFLFFLLKIVSFAQYKNYEYNFYIELLDEKNSKTIDKTVKKNFLKNIGKNLGIIKVESSDVELFVRDYGSEDGDIIDLWVNGKQLIKNFLLTNSGYRQKITLYRRENILTIKALNEGDISPNTAELILKYNNKEKMESWGLSTNEIGSFKIFY